MQPTLWNKLVSSENIISVRNEKIITGDNKIAKVLNDISQNVMKALNIPETNHSDSNFENVRDLTLTAIRKYHNHLSILAIKKRLKVVRFLL